MIHGDKLRGHLEALILAILEQDQAHGLEILRRLEESACGLLQLKEGSLYPALYRLERAEEVAADWEPQPHRRRGARRRVYRLTEKGTKKLAQARAEWQQFVQVIGDIIGLPPRR
jgi:DNA-binding PadR family transcriptional regulator